MQRLNDSDEGMALVKNNGEKYLYNSMGVAFKLYDDELYAVKVPVVNGKAKKSEAVMIDISDEDHPEYPDVRIPHKAIKDLLEWYNSLEE
jgi:hypothetical protein